MNFNLLRNDAKKKKTKKKPISFDGFPLGLEL